VDLVVYERDLGAPGARARVATPKPNRSLYRRFLKDVAKAELPSGPGSGDLVNEDDLASLPATARRYMEFMGAPGRPRDWSLRARFVGRFRLRPHAEWLPAEAWQYNTALEVGRVYTMRIAFAGVLPMVGKDTYLKGHGEMLGKLMGMFKVAEGHGDEFDIGELTTYLNDAILLAPSFLLGPNTTWAEVDDDSFDVTLADAGRHVTARVLIDERGAPVDFSTTDRFADLPGGLVRAKWTTPAPVWLSGAGRPVPGPISAVWHLADGPLPYVEGRLIPESIVYNVAPGS
jgi:hypothetical protein